MVYLKPTTQLFQYNPKTVSVFCVGNIVHGRHLSWNARTWEKNQPITVTSHERLKFLAIRLYVQQLVHAKIIKNKTKLHTTGPLWRESTGDGWFPSRMAYNTESVPMSWDHHVNWCCSHAVVFIKASQIPWLQSHGQNGIMFISKSDYQSHLS